MAEREFIHVSCLIDYLKNNKSDVLANAAETLSVSTVMNEMEEAASNNNPTAIQYTHGVGNMAQKLASHNLRTAVLFDSQEAFDFSTELLEDQEALSGHLMLIEDPVSLEEGGFPMSPDQAGWQLVILDDILPFVGKDADVTNLLKLVHSTMKDDGNLILRIAQFKDDDSWSREHNDTVVTEAIDKVGMRRFKRSFTSHGNISLRHEEDIFAFDVSDLHDCARNASFRPTRELGLDPSIWCCYEKV